MRKLILIILALFILLVGGVALFSFIPSLEDKYVIENCPDLEGKVAQPIFVGSDEFIDCREIVAIERWDKDPYMTMRIFYPDQELDERRSIRDFRISGDFLYYIDEPSTVTGYGFSPETGTGEYVQINGAKASFRYSSLEEIPIYRKVNIKTGDFTLYKILDVVPESERKIFEELE